jgi:hypothetical protein
MDAKKKLMQERTKLLNQIAELAQRGQSHEVLAAGERLNKVESLIERYEKLVNDISNLETDIPQNTRIDSRNSRVKNHKGQNFVATGRGTGKTIRMDFLKTVSEKGIYIENIRGSIYKAQSGRKVGIAVATERKPDRWFLGLPSKGFDDAVLLCKPDSGDTIEICLSKDFFDEYGEKMSESSGQMKFNVARRGGGYVILVPGTDGINVSKFLGDYSVLG